jgi:hypothetical protein
MWSLCSSALPSTIWVCLRSSVVPLTVSKSTVRTRSVSSLSVPNTRIQTAWDAISLHTTPGIAAYKPLEVELLYNGVGLDVLGIGYDGFPEDLRTKIVGQFPRVNFKQDIAEAFLHGFEHKTQTTEGTCNEDICSHFIRNYKRSNFYDQIQNSPFQNS